MRLPQVGVCASAWLLISLLWGGASARAQSGGGFSLTWSTLDGGGMTFGQGGPYRLGGTVGQPDPVESTGGGFTLWGGFWQAWLGAVSGVETEPGDSAPSFAIQAPTPNPFHTAVFLLLDLPGSSAVEVRVFDVAGRKVRELVRGVRPGGRQSITWDGRNDRGTRLPSGVYFMEVKAGERRGVKRVVLLD